MIYLIHGVDSFRAREKLNEIIGEFRKRDPSGVNLSVFDTEEENLANKIKAAAETLGFLSPSRMIVIKNLFSEGADETKKQIVNFVLAIGKKKSGPEFIFSEEKEIGKKKSPKDDVVSGGKEWTAMAKNGTVFHFTPLALTELRKWILTKFKKEEIKITPSALDKLILYVGDDLWRLSQEIEKLVLLKAEITPKIGRNVAATCGERSQTISEEDVESLVKSDLPTSIFATIDALARRDKKTALKLLAGHLEKGEQSIYLFSMFAYQFSNLIRAKELLRRGIADSGEIASMLKMHPFVAKKTVPYAAKFSMEYLKKIHKRLLRLDFLIKKGRIQAEAALEMIVIEVGNLA